MQRHIIPADDNPALREVAREIPVHDIAGKAVQGLIADMKKLLKPEKYGVALAAPQVGEAVRLFIISGKALAKRSRDGANEPEPDDAIYINPRITKMSKGGKDKHEGCLSIRGIWGDVPRAEKVTLEYYDEHGKKQTRGASGFLAHIFQHEVDHLDGILYIDKAAQLYEDEPENEHDEN